MVGCPVQKREVFAMLTLSDKPLEVGEAWDLSYKRTVSAPAWEQAQLLLSTIGPRTTAAGLGLADARQVKAWVRDESGPREHLVAGRLALLCRITLALTSVYSPATATLFLRSSNPQLDDDVPLLILRDGDPDVVQGRLLAATRAFLEG